MTIPDPKPQFFFAPSQLSKRGNEWGREVLNDRIADALSTFIDSTHPWLEIRRAVGSESIGELYSALVRGDVPAQDGNIISFE
ncbi:MAG: DUF2855 family protein [Acidimicrobiia bacterium]|nr:DUF2855 family protein [Acidimicrobiia bacterium]